MINIPNNVTQPINRNNLWSLNKKVAQPLNKNSVFDLNVNRQNNNMSVGSQQQARTQAYRNQWNPPNNAGGSFVQSQIPNNYPNQTRQNAGRPTTSVNTTTPPVTRQNPYVQNRTTNTTVSPAIQQGGTPVVNNMVIPSLQKPLQKGQKASLNLQGNSTRVKACFGWNVSDQRCDIDVSAFLVTSTGKVPADDWFVFYGQETSPDNSVRFQVDSTHKDREIIDVDFARVNQNIKKIIFVMTINEAFQQNLNFSMIKDAYIRILDANSQSELLSYRMDQYYANVTSMTIGELYIHNGMWKFNPVGNGVHQDLAGQCAIYGVEIC